MTKSVQIQIATTDLEFLKANNYKLCFAKKVNDTYDVVWQSFTEYLASNTFSWNPVYQIFGTNTFQTSVQVVVQTNVVTTTLGEQVTMDSAGNIGNPVSGGPSTSITFINNHGPIHPGVNSVSTGPDGIQRTTPIYVAPAAITTGSDVLTPVEMVQVWFAQNLATSTMISKDVSNYVEIDLTEVDSAKRLYQSGTWSVPTAAQSDDPQTYLTMTVAVVGAVTAAMLAQKITSYLTGVYQTFSVKVNANANTFSIAYSEKPKLNSVERRHLALLAADPATLDALVEFAMKGLAACGSGFTVVSAKASD